MSRIAKILSFVRTFANNANVTDVEVDTGGGDNKTAQNFSAPGDDSFPLLTDYALISDVARAGSKAVHGYLDPLNAGIALSGDKRIYGRDKDSGAPVNQVWLQNDGSILISNDKGAITMLVNGDVNINGVVIKATGAMIIPSSLTLANKEIAGHTHSQGIDGAGNIQVDTDGNN